MRLLLYSELSEEPGNLGVGGLAEVLVPGPDRLHTLGPYDGDFFDHQRRKRSEGFGRCHRDSQDEPSRP